MRSPATLFCITSASAVSLASALAVLLVGTDVQGQPNVGPSPDAAASPACPADMVLVPGGTVTFGAGGEVDALPPTTRAMAPFCIDRTEVTVARYRACVAAGRCPPPETTISFPGYGPPEPMRAELSRFCNVTHADHEQHPMNCVDQPTAAQFCSWTGGRLPDEEEWEVAARGANAQPFPWGPRAPVGNELCWDRRVSGLGTCPVGQFPGGASPVGALDMAGNVWEWTSSKLGEGGVVRGGGWTNFLSRFVSPTYRWPLVPAMRLNCLGFRCVVALPK